MDKKTLTKKIIITVLLVALSVITIFAILDCVNTIITNIEHRNWLLENEYELNIDVNNNFVKNFHKVIIKQFSFLFMYVVNIFLYFYFLIKIWCNEIIKTKFSYQEYKENKKIKKKQKLLNQKKQIEKALDEL
jgi:hypothetical protein